MVCAKELNIPQISEYMKHMGITDEELEQLSDQMMDMMDGDSFEMGWVLERCRRFSRT